MDKENNWHIDSVSGHVYRDDISITVKRADGTTIDTLCHRFSLTEGEKDSTLGVGCYTHDLSCIDRNELLEISDLAGNKIKGYVSHKDVSYGSGGFKTLSLYIKNKHILN